MSVSRKDFQSCLADVAWDELLRLEDRHQAAEAAHDQQRRRLDAAISSADQLDLQLAWEQYRSVVAQLAEVTESIESFRYQVS
jgi:hypothetical protein